MDTVTPNHVEMLKAASDLMTEMADTIDRLQNELAVAKAANSHKVELEKVASPKGISAEKAAEFSAYLASREIIRDDEREKYASACLEDPNMVIDIAKHALKLSELPASQGYGIKTANAGMTAENESVQAERKLWGSLAHGIN